MAVERNGLLLNGGGHLRVSIALILLAGVFLRSQGAQCGQRLLIKPRVELLELVEGRPSRLQRQPSAHMVDVTIAPDTHLRVARDLHQLECGLVQVEACLCSALASVVCVDNQGAIQDRQEPCHASLPERVSHLPQPLRLDCVQYVQGVIYELRRSYWPIVRARLLLHPSLGPEVPRTSNPLTLAPLTRDVGEQALSLPHIQERHALRAEAAAPRPARPPFVLRAN